MEGPITMTVSTLATLISSVLFVLIQRFLNAQKKREEEREAEKACDNAIILRSLNALGKLTVANAIALRDGKTNGELATALAEYEKIEKEMYDHLVTYHSKSVM